MSDTSTLTVTLAHILGHCGRAKPGRDGSTSSEQFLNSSLGLEAPNKHDIDIHIYICIDTEVDIYISKA